MVHRVAPPVVAVLGLAPRLAERGRRLSSAVELVLTDRYSYASDVPLEVVDWTAAMIASTPVDVIAQFFPAFDAHDKLASLDVLRGLQVLLLCGDSDLMTPPDHTRGMAEVLPDAELVLVPDAGHMVIAEYPEVVNDGLRRLLGRLAPGGPA
jgi:pimeloyl-ACP methyl ester carboxylesterase